MAAGDFLRRRAKTPLRECFVAAGATCELSTNCETILEAARETFIPLTAPAPQTDFRLRFWVDSDLSSKPPWPKPYIRGLGSLVFAGFDPENSLLADRRAGRVIGRFSPAMGADALYWKMAAFPLVISILGGSIGSTELHCACVANKNGGLLLAGPTGSGKSTLSWALARMGFSFLSDDRTHVSRRNGHLLAWSVNPFIKLRLESAAMFPELGRLLPRMLPNGERAYSFSPDPGFGVSISRCCTPRWLFFLERRRGATLRLTPMAPAEVARRLSLDLLAETGEVSDMQLETIAQLAQRECWHLAYSGSPVMTAESVARFVETGLGSKAFLAAGE